MTVKDERKTTEKQGCAVGIDDKMQGSNDHACGPVPKVNGRHVGIGRCAYVLCAVGASGVRGRGAVDRHRGLPMPLA